MLQKRMIESFRERCHQDNRVVSALMFGSFATGEGDRFSDIEFASLGKTLVFKVDITESMFVPSKNKPLFVKRVGPL